jgi:uncharacterized membrane protein YgaE (UPF0421/DUF939 family)
MNTDPSVSQSNSSRAVTSLVVKRLLQVIIVILLQASILFVSSGRFDWLMAWVYVGVYVGIVLVNVMIILPKDPELIAERAKVKENTKGWDRILIGIVGVFTPAISVVAGLDLRFGWSPRIALAIQLMA